MLKVSKKVWLIVTGAVLAVCAFLVLSGTVVLAAPVTERVNSDDACAYLGGSGSWLDPADPNAGFDCTYDDGSGSIESGDQGGSGGGSGDSNGSGGGTTQPDTKPINGCDETSILQGLCDESSTRGEGIWGILNIIMTILTIGVGAAAIIGIVIAGIIYGTAGGNESKVTQAKQMIFNVVLGLLLYGVLWAVVNFIMPGEIATNESEARPQSSPVQTEAE